MSSIPIVPYETLSSEYYDDARHPTCADFRHASLRLISGYLSLANLAPASRILEVGAGRSVFVDLSDEFSHLMDNLVVTDESPGMLRHTRLESRNVRLMHANAEAVPFPDAAFDVMIASLGDPYNTERFWREASRVLDRGGRCIFTTPAATWSDRYRRDEQSGQHEIAIFETTAGATVGVPSFVLTPVEQTKFLDGLGLAVTDIWTFTRDMYPQGKPSSPKILEFTDGDVPVVCQYVVRKRASDT